MRHTTCRQAIQLETQTPLVKSDSQMKGFGIWQEHHPESIEFFLGPRQRNGFAHCEKIRGPAATITSTTKASLVSSIKIHHALDFVYIRQRYQPFPLNHQAAPLKLHLQLQHRPPRNKKTSSTTPCLSAVLSRLRLKVPHHFSSQANRLHLPIFDSSTVSAIPLRPPNSAIQTTVKMNTAVSAAIAVFELVVFIGMLVILFTNLGHNGFQPS